MNVVSNLYSIVPALILIHCQPDSLETLFVQCFCLSRSPFTSFPAIVLTSSGQQSEVCINSQTLTHIASAPVHCCGDCLILNCSVNCIVYFQLLIQTLEAKASEKQKTGTKLAKLYMHVIVIWSLSFKVSLCSSF